MVRVIRGRRRGGVSLLPSASVPATPEVPEPPGSPARKTEDAIVIRYRPLPRASASDGDGARRNTAMETEVRQAGGVARDMDRPRVRDLRPNDRRREPQCVRRKESDGRGRFSSLLAKFLCGLARPLLFGQIPESPQTLTAELRVGFPREGEEQERESCGQANLAHSIFSAEPRREVICSDLCTTGEYCSSGDRRIYAAQPKEGGQGRESRARSAGPPQIGRAAQRVRRVSVSHSGADRDFGRVDLCVTGRAVGKSGPTPSALHTRHSPGVTASPAVTGP